MNYLKEFCHAKARAKNRGIDWRLTYEQWLDAWEQSGHLAERGRGRGKFVMARIGDSGPYAIGNIYFCTGAQNMRDASTNGRLAHRRDGKDATPEQIAEDRKTPPRMLAAGSIEHCPSYREAVRLCWENRRLRTLSRKQVAMEAGCYASHVTDYLADDDTRRELPAKHINGFEISCGNRAISQWLAAQAHLTILETFLQQRAAA